MNETVTALQKRTPNTFPEMLKAYQTEIARALPRHMNPDRLARIALTEFRKNPRLRECKPASVFAAVIQASQLGLEPGLMGQAYLIPYKDECQLIPGYQGLLDLVRRAGKVKRIEAHVVHDGDRFVYRTGLVTTLEHEPKLDGEAGEPRLAYAVAEFQDGGYHVEVMTRQQIESIRDRSQNVQRAKRSGQSTPWDTHGDEMWRKTVLRRICKFLPKSAELAMAIALDDAADRGAQGITAQDAIDGTWVPVQEVTTVETPPNGEQKPEPEITLPPPQTWPKRTSQGFVDSSGEIYNEDRHAAIPRGQSVPTVNSDGTFRRRRGSEQSTPKPTDPGISEAEQQAMAMIAAAVDAETCNEAEFEVSGQPPEVQARVHEAAEARRRELAGQ